MKCLTRGKKLILAAVLSLAMVCTSNMYYENEKILNVYAATEKEATDIGISSTADVILYAENGTGATAKLQAANTEYLETQLTGGTTFKKLEYSFEAKNMDKQYVNEPHMLPAGMTSWKAPQLKHQVQECSPVQIILRHRQVL